MKSSRRELIESTNQLVGGLDISNTGKQALNKNDETKAVDNREQSFLYGEKIEFPTPSARKLKPEELFEKEAGINYI